jgi:hypothetical protein
MAVSPFNPLVAVGFGGRSADFTTARQRPHNWRIVLWGRDEDWPTLDGVSRFGKRGIIGSFNTVNFPAFRAIAPPFVVYANLEDFSGIQEFSVTITLEGAELVVFSAGGEIHFQDENREAEVVCRHSA